MARGAGAALHGEPHRLVEHQHVGVLVQRDRCEELARLRRRPRAAGVRGLGGSSLSGGMRTAWPACKPVLRLRALAVHAQLAFADDALDVGERKPGKRASRNRSTRMPASSAVTATVCTPVVQGAAAGARRRREPEPACCGPAASCALGALGALRASAAQACGGSGCAWSWPRRPSAFAPVRAQYLTSVMDAATRRSEGGQAMTPSPDRPRRARRPRYRSPPARPWRRCRPTSSTKIAAIGRVVDAQKTGEIYTPLQEKEPYAGIKVARDVKYGPDPRNIVDVFTAEGATGARPVLMFVHGGGLIRGNKRTPGSAVLRQHHAVGRAQRHGRRQRRISPGARASLAGGRARTWRRPCASSARTLRPTARDPAASS